MKWIDEVDGRLHLLWMFWSVRFNVLSAACSGAVAVYEGFKLADPQTVTYIPTAVIGALATGAVIFTFAGILARGIVQPKLQDPCEDKP